MPRSSVVRGAATVLARDAARMARALGSTYGPDASPVVYGTGRDAYELLDDSAVLARRLDGLPAGAALVRELTQTVRTGYGDGAATAVVLAEALLHQVSRPVAGGLSRTELRRGLERGVDAAVSALLGSARPVSGVEDLRALALGATKDEELAAVLAELYDLLGANAAVVVEERSSPGLERFYIDGGQWRARPADRALLPDGTSELTLYDPLVVVVDSELHSADDILPLLELAIAEQRPMLIVAHEIDDEAGRALLANLPRVSVVGVCLTSALQARGDDLDDIALLTGGAILGAARGSPSSGVRIRDCGTARWVVVHRDRLTVTRGPGDVAGRVHDLSGRAAEMRPGTDEWHRLRLRVARLAGALGILAVGAYTEAELDLRKRQAAKAQRVLESALRDGVLPGAGIAYAQCVSDVEKAASAASTRAESCGIEAVACALAEPRRRLGGSGGGAGVLDSAGVLVGALRSAAGLVGSMVGTEVIVSCR